MWRSIASNGFSILLVGLFLAGGAILWGRATFDQPGPLTQAICFDVPSGVSFNKMTEDLAAKDAVSSAMLLRLGAEYSGRSDKHKAGSYIIEPQSSMEQVLDIVTRGGASSCGTEIVYRVGINRVSVQIRDLDPQTGRFMEQDGFVLGQEAAPELYEELRADVGTRFRIAFAEGVTSWQIVEAINAIDLLEGEIDQRPPEGALAPDSYELVPGQNRAELISLMEERQLRWVSEAWAARAEALPLQTPEELVILASIIEKETSLEAERHQVSSVFVNRLRQGMRLQTDPTVIYGITQGEGVLGRGLRRSELRAATPWNTYVIEGLPPTPIANPGRASLMAAAQPDETPFIFFVADGTGGHAFAVTYEEHQQNVAVWRQIEAERESVQDGG